MPAAEILRTLTCGKEEEFSEGLMNLGILQDTWGRSECFEIEFVPDET
jgi:hypothetical protein